MQQMISSYNIPEPEPMYAGSYRELYFELLDENSKAKIDLTNIPDIRFIMTAWGDYQDPELDITYKSNTPNRIHIKIDEVQKNQMTVYLYADDTESFGDTYYDFQIEFMDYDKKYNSIIGQGRIKVFSKIN